MELIELSDEVSTGSGVERGHPVRQRRSPLHFPLKIPFEKGSRSRSGGQDVALHTLPVFIT